MKKSNLFKIISVIISMVILSGCAATGGTGGDAEEAKFVIGINQLAEHPALDAAREGFVEALEEAGVDVEIKYQNAQGDIPTSLAIAQGFVKDEVDIIYAIATPAAQSSKQATSDIPVLFSAVTDPVASELVESMESPGANVTGASDATPMKEQLSMFKQLDPSFEKIGILFNTSESNSEIQVARAKEFAQELGLEIVAVGISNINDIPQAMDSMIDDIDGFYAITDNMVASAIAIVADKLNSASIPSVGAEGSLVEGGLLVSNGISYFELGKQAGEMARKILVDGISPAEIPAEQAKETTAVFNQQTLELLGLNSDHEVFQGAEAVGE
ncbi:ABC transporter substrate-binding protein [Gudongella sp. DL1XJH-153]|uniref:ABC transporter substrate-binding protein n=1 Tax=Gudongella sp. DL1XJH-153 TaxID=3409804 RepID=UPI003BB51191